MRGGSIVHVSMCVCVRMCVCACTRVCDVIKMAAKGHDVAGEETAISALCEDVATFLLENGVFVCTYRARPTAP